MSEKKQKKKKTIGIRILELLILVSLGASLFFGGKYLYSYYEQHKNSEIALNKVDSVLNKKIDYRKKSPNIGTVIGKMRVEGLTEDMPIIEGEDLNLALNHGVGHLEGTPMPGKGSGQPALSGHRETFFRNLKDAKNGDVVVVTMPYGTFKYKISSKKITKPSDGAAIYDDSNVNGERLALVTCYPFSIFSSPDERIIFYADPIE